MYLVPKNLAAGSCRPTDTWGHKASKNGQVWMPAVLAMAGTFTRRTLRSSLHSPRHRAWYLPWLCPSRRSPRALENCRYYREGMCQIFLVARAPVCWQGRLQSACPMTSRHWKHTQAQVEPTTSWPFFIFFIFFYTSHLVRLKAFWFSPNQNSGVQMMGAVPGLESSPETMLAVAYDDQHGQPNDNAELIPQLAHPVQSSLEAKLPRRPQTMALQAGRPPPSQPP